MDAPRRSSARGSCTRRATPSATRATLEVEEALAFADGRVLATGRFAELAGAHADAEIIDARGAFLLPGLVDTHVHWPQLGIVGAMGLELLDWLRQRTLPEEARLADLDYARPLARDFLRGARRQRHHQRAGVRLALPRGAGGLLRGGRARSGLRIASGLVVSDRDLLPVLQRTPGAAYEAGLELARRWHGEGRLRYAVTPRFSLSCSEAMLESCAALAGELDGALVTSHINENEAEVRRPWPSGSRGPTDYLETYDRTGSSGPRPCSPTTSTSPTPSSLGWPQRGPRPPTARRATPSSAAASSRMRRHLDHGVRFALGTDVGAGTGLSLLGEGLMSYQAQMLGAGRACACTPAHLLWLATRGRRRRAGSGGRGRRPGAREERRLRADPPAGRDRTPGRDARPQRLGEDALGAIFTLAREESVVEVRVAGIRWPSRLAADERASRRRDPGAARRAGAPRPRAGRGDLARLRRPRPAPDRRPEGRRLLPLRPDAPPRRQLRGRLHGRLVLRRLHRLLRRRAHPQGPRRPRSRGATC